MMECHCDIFTSRYTVDREHASMDGTKKLSVSDDEQVNLNHER